jgi:hypothetical protein
MPLEHRYLERQRARLAAKKVHEGTPSLLGDIDARKVVVPHRRAEVNGKLRGPLELDDIAKRRKCRTRKQFDDERFHGDIRCFALRYVGHSIDDAPHSQARYPAVGDDVEAHVRDGAEGAD